MTFTDRMVLRDLSIIFDDVSIPVEMLILYSQRWKAANAKANNAR